METVVALDDRDVPASVARVQGWYLANADDLYRFVARRLGSGPAADAVADVFRVAIEHLDRYEPARGNERAWLFGIAVNIVRRHRRTELRRLRAVHRLGSRSAGAVPIDGFEEIDRRLDAGPRAARVMRAVAELSPEDRDLLTLIAWESMSPTEVAEILDIPPATVRTRLHRIRKSLRIHLSGNPHG